MRPPLLIGLALALGATIWVSSQDDGAVEPVRADARRPAARSAAEPGHDEPGDTRAEGKVEARASRGRAARPSAARPAENTQQAWAQRQLIEGVALWQKRQAGDGWVDSPRSGGMAWASLQPPPVRVVQAVTEAPPPPPPMAPPFPHKWVGRYNDETADAAEPAASSASASASKPIQRAVVVGPSTTWVLKEGDVIEGQWRVDRIDARTMQLTYLPLKLPQTLAMR